MTPPWKTDKIVCLLFCSLQRWLKMLILVKILWYGHFCSPVFNKYFLTILNVLPPPVWTLCYFLETVGSVLITLGIIVTVLCPIKVVGITLLVAMVLFTTVAPDNSLPPDTRLATGMVTTSVTLLLGDDSVRSTTSIGSWLCVDDILGSAMGTEKVMSLHFSVLNQWIQLST